MTPTMLTLLGQSLSHSSYLESLLALLRAKAPDLQVARIRNDAVYVLALREDAGWDDEAFRRTRELLDAVGEMSPVAGEGFFVTPRKGTRSPWSSKATDIFQHCGLTAVLRVEHGRWFRLYRDDGAVIAPASIHSALWPLFHDRMTEGVSTDLRDLLDVGEPAPLQRIDVLKRGRAALEAANTDMGLALNDEEIDYLLDVFQRLNRNPADAELLMFGQVNSEHCRHKIFNARWIIDGRPQPVSLFDMIRHTHKCHPQGTLVAYSDNAAVIEGFEESRFESDPADAFRYRSDRGRADIVMKVETHNHPTAISPWPGAATGVGGEIRDEAATGRGAFSKAGLSAFIVSHLRLPGFEQPWEHHLNAPPPHLATPLEIMRDGPLGGAAFGNEFGRPQLCGLFRTFEIRHAGRDYGYFKPIMAAGGMGRIRRIHAAKQAVPADAVVLQLGGPALRIGLGGGAASSMASGSNAAELDFNSVQRDNAEMQRRCQEVINVCCALKERNPIISIHDIGAGGLSNGCPELVAETGGRFFLRRIDNQEPSMSPMEIWCCEAQERYVLAVPRDRLDEFMALCRRERCPAAAIGETTGDGRLILEDALFNDRPIDLELDVILGRPPKMVRDVRREPLDASPLRFEGVDLDEAVSRVLRFPAVARKTFLITIADRSVTGLVARDQMVGPHQTPVADVAVTLTDYQALTGEAMAMGERVNLAPLNAPASGRMAVTEALTNLAAADIGDIGKVKLSANWMCACGEDGQDAALYDTVQTVGLSFCPELGVSIPVGKDSLSMRSKWTDAQGIPRNVSSPVSLIVSAFAPVRDARRTLTPQWQALDDDTVLLLADLGGGRNRLGGSVLAQVTCQMGEAVPDIDQPRRVAAFFQTVQTLLADGRLLAYHDRSDGGLLVTVAEMGFAARRGCRLDLDGNADDSAAVFGALFAEEAGAVIQVRQRDLAAVEAAFERFGIRDLLHRIGTPTRDPAMTVAVGGTVVFRQSIREMERCWSELTWRMQSLRDDPESAAMEYAAVLDAPDAGMTPHLTFEPEAPYVASGKRPPLAILREQGVNGHVEMAAAFDRAGFECCDVHMTDLLEGQRDLTTFAGLVACGGFSYGDVLGAGTGWARTILYNERLKTMFAGFFARADTFALGVCNGCQMLAQLRDIIPGADLWPRFLQNRSQRFEARFVTVELLPSPSLFFREMVGSRLGVPVAHGEGRAEFADDQRRQCETAGLVAARYVDHGGHPTERYPLNPNGSPGGITGVTTRDGRVTIMMPHPERGFRAIQHSWRPADMTGEAGWWLRMFQNARRFVD